MTSRRFVCLSTSFLNELLNRYTFLRNPDSNDAVRCPNHPGANLVEDYHAGDMVCPECGIVVGDRLESSFNTQTIVTNVYEVFRVDV